LWEIFFKLLLFIIIGFVLSFGGSYFICYSNINVFVFAIVVSIGGFIMYKAGRSLIS